MTPREHATVAVFALGCLLHPLYDLIRSRLKEK